MKLLPYEQLIAKLEILMYHSNNGNIIEMDMETLCQIYATLKIQNADITGDDIDKEDD